MTERIEVFCDEAAHASRVVEIAAFESERDVEHAWHEVPVHTRSQARPETMVGRDGRQLVKPAGQAILEGDHGVRRRTALRCRACDLSLPLREERLFSMLDGLADARVGRVRLSALVATMA